MCSILNDEGTGTVSLQSRHKCLSTEPPAIKRNAFNVAYLKLRQGLLAHVHVDAVKDISRSQCVCDLEMDISEEV